MTVRSPESHAIQPPIATPNPVPLPSRAPLSITLKLLALIGATTGAVVLFLAIYFPSRQIESSHAALELKAATYARLISRQIAPAIAFDDRQTAREIFDSVGQDPDVESLLLLTSTGATLHVRGEPGGWVGAAKGGVTEQRVLEFQDRIAVVSPVVSAEGPRGTLIVELSTRTLTLTKAAVTQTAVLVGIIALALGMLLAYAIARSLGRRLASIARAASEVAAGQLQHDPVIVRGHDEIATLARAFNAMLAQIQTLFAQIKHSAEQEQGRLGGLVRERTQELDGRNRAMRLVLDNVDQGFLSVDLDGRLAEERSAIVDRWLGVPAPDATLFSHVDTAFPGKGDYLRVAWEGLREEWMPLEMGLGQLPSEFEHASLHLGFTYRPIFENERLSKLLVIVSDMTPLAEKRRAEEEERELVQIVRKLLVDQSGFREYLAEADELVLAICGTVSDLPSLLRMLHTLKGNSAIFGFDSLVRLCHELEDVVQNSGAELIVLDKHRLVAAWARLRDKVNLLLKGRSEDTIELRRIDLAHVVANLNAGVPVASICALIEAWELEPTEPRLQRSAEYGRALAVRLAKGPVLVGVESNDVRLDPRAWSGFWHALVHVVRNAIDHGLEQASERVAANKPETATVLLRSSLEAGELTIEIEDDGAGIDWLRVAGVARTRGLAADTRDQLVQALFSDGLSTRDETTEISGRGVGLSAVREACLRTGGRITVSSTAGQGSVFGFRWSVDSMGRPLTKTQGGTPILGSISHIQPATPSVRSSKVVNAW
jgi:HAMP domain-containing protein/HPt (histidine-containing phosphotransfer) domain-containing protein